MAAELYIASRTQAMRVPRKRIGELVNFIARRERTALHDVDVTVVDSREMTRLNRTYLQHAGTTDVISFDLTDRRAELTPGLTVQLIVNAQLAVKEASRRSHGPQRELLLYVAHGLLHAMGYDDQTPADAKTMSARQEQLLDAFLAGRRT
ncbi:MAG: rRNA maturation RNase YbeY [Planctomycetes bacterium]|jgi:probable rRNA maturation factor|nr:rRNA maturation RNase YbeY [Planctomycetota bacterium]